MAKIRNLKALQDKHGDELKGATIQKEEYPDTHPLKSGVKVLDTFGNLDYLLKRFGITVRWNLMARMREIIIPGQLIFEDDTENCALALVTNLAILNHMPVKLIDSHLDIIGQRFAYHPIVECMKANPWDGEPRLQRFIETVQTENNLLSHKLIRRWMIGAIAAAHSDQGIALQGALVLQGKQRVGKTEWVKSLDPINCGAILDGALLDPSNKDSLIYLSRHWIIELGELDGTFKKADIARIKGYLTSKCDEVRFPFARKVTRLGRRTAFVATVNESNFLIDTTGNRRWWTIPVISIDLSHGLNMLQVWAEVFALWKGGESHNLNEEEFTGLMVHNVQHEVIDPIEEGVAMLFDWVPNWREYNTQEFTGLQVLKMLKIDKPTMSESKRVVAILEKMTNSKPVRRKSGRYFTVPVMRSHSQPL